MDFMHLVASGTTVRAGQNSGRHSRFYSLRVAHPIGPVVCCVFGGVCRPPRVFGDFSPIFGGIPIESVGFPISFRRFGPRVNDRLAHAGFALGLQAVRMRTVFAIGSFVFVCLTPRAAFHSNRSITSRGLSSAPVTKSAIDCFWAAKAAMCRSSLHIAIKRITLVSCSCPIRWMRFRACTTSS